MARKVRRERCLQATESKDTAQSNLLCPWLMKTPYVWDGEDQKRPVCDDVGYGIADEESVDVDCTSRVRRLIPL